MAEPRRWDWNLEEMREAEAMDVPSAPLVQGFTPVNTPLAKADTLGEADAPPSPVKKPGKAKIASKAPVSAPRASKKRKQTQVSTAEPVKKSKSSGSKGSKERNDISKAMQRTKPGIARDVLPGKGTVVSSTPALPELSIAATPSKYTSCQQDAANPPTVRSKSIQGSLGQTYQNAFPAPALLRSGGHEQTQGRTSPGTLGGTFEDMMDSLIDDASFFRSLGIRPKKSFVDSNDPSMAKEGVPRTVSYRHQEPVHEGALLQLAEHEQEAGNQDSFFDEALEHNALKDINIECISPSVESLSANADSSSMKAAQSGNMTESTSAPTDIVQDTASRASGSVYTDPSSDVGEADEIDEFPIDDDEFPIFNEDKCFECDQHGVKIDVSNKVDSAYRGADQLAQDIFNDEELDAELLNLSTPASEHIHGQSPPFTQYPPPGPKLNWRPPTSYTPAKSAYKPNSSVQNSSPISTTIRTPFSKTSPNIGPQSLSLSKDGKPLPFIRPPFPTAILPRSPITGLSPNTVLRICFRIGEAVNAASIALRNSKDAVIELYCRIKYSDRQPNGYKQFFELADLFAPEKPPFLNGVYAIWKGVGLWEHDSKAFLGEGGRGKMARVMGRIKRGEANKGWEMTILNVWEASWEDVGVVKGVVCS